MIEQIAEFFYSYKNNTIEANEIATHQKTLQDFSNQIKNSEFYEQYYNDYLNIKGYTYRLENPSLRLFHTFQEAIYSIDLAKLMRDVDSISQNSVVYALVVSDCISEYLNESIDEELKTKAIEFYKNETQKKNKENQKYHIYQY